MGDSARAAGGRRTGRARQAAPAAIFIAVLAIGAAAFAWMGASGFLVHGMVVFAVAALVGMVWFVTIAQVKGDKSRTVDDYRKARRA